MPQNKELSTRNKVKADYLYIFEQFLTKLNFHFLVKPYSPLIADPSSPVLLRVLNLVPGVWPVFHIVFYLDLIRG